MKNYKHRVYGYFDFGTDEAPTVIRQKLAKMIRESGFEEKNFEIGVDGNELKVEKNGTLL